MLPRAGIFQGWGGPDPQVTCRASELERPQRIAPRAGAVSFGTRGEELGLIG